MDTLREGEGPDFVDGVVSVGGLRRDGTFIEYKGKIFVPTWVDRVVQQWSFLDLGREDGVVSW